MNRRTAIRNVIIISAGAGLLPSCAGEDKSGIVLKNISITGQQEKMLAALTESILPKTKDFIGANDLKAHQFLLTMIDDCTSPEDQQKFIEGLKDFDKQCDSRYGHSFHDCTAEQKKALLQAVETKKDIPEDVNKFYGTVKRYTIQSFTSCKEYMEGVRKYKMVPGPDFKGCVQAS